MPEPRSPLAHKCVDAAPGGHAARVTLGTRPLHALWQIAGWADFSAAAAPLLARFGFSGVGDYRRAQVVDGRTLWRIAPDRLLIEGAGDLSGDAADNLAVLDLSHARAVIRCEGPAARTLLSQVVTVDVAPEAFGVGAFVQTGLHHVAVLIQCKSADAFEIFAPATWAEAVWDILAENARVHGCAVDGAG